MTPQWQPLPSSFRGLIGATEAPIPSFLPSRLICALGWRVKNEMGENFFNGVRQRAPLLALPFERSTRLCVV